MLPNPNGSVANSSRQKYPLFAANGEQQPLEAPSHHPKSLSQPYGPFQLPPSRPLLRHLQLPYPARRKRKAAAGNKKNNTTNLPFSPSPSFFPRLSLIVNLQANSLFHSPSSITSWARSYPVSSPSPTAFSPLLQAVPIRQSFLYLFAVFFPQLLERTFHNTLHSITANRESQSNASPLYIPYTLVSC